MYVTEMLRVRSSCLVLSVMRCLTRNDTKILSNLQIFELSRQKVAGCVLTVGELEEQRTQFLL